MNDLSTMSTRRSTKQTVTTTNGQHHRFIAHYCGIRLAAQSAQSLYGGKHRKNYVWRGSENLLAAQLKAQLLELGIS